MTGPARAEINIMPRAAATLYRVPVCQLGCGRPMAISSSFFSRPLLGLSLARPGVLLAALGPPVTNRSRQANLRTLACVSLVLLFGSGAALGSPWGAVDRSWVALGALWIPCWRSWAALGAARGPSGWSRAFVGASVGGLGPRSGRKVAQT